MTNIGFAPGASHTHGGSTNAQHPMQDLPVQPLTGPIVHPERVVEDLGADRWIDLHIYRTRRSLRGRVLRSGIQQLQRAGMRHPILTRLNDGQG